MKNIVGLAQAKAMAHQDIEEAEEFVLHTRIDDNHKELLACCDSFIAGMLNAPTTGTVLVFAILTRGIGVN